MHRHRGPPDDPSCSLCAGVELGKPMFWVVPGSSVSRRAGVVCCSEIVEGENPRSFAAGQLVQLYPGGHSGGSCSGWGGSAAGLS